MNENIAQIAKMLVPLLEEELRNKSLIPKTGEIKKEDPSTWPPKLMKAWEDCCAECQKGEMNAPFDTGSGSDDGGL